MSELEDLLRINMTQGVGVVLYRQLLERFGSSNAILSATQEELQKVDGIGPTLAANIKESANELDTEKELQLADKLGIKIIPYDSDSYPKNLKTIFDPPLVLYVKGEIMEDDTLCLAVIGSRRCSHYGRSQAERLSVGLANVGFCIVSGLARGIDAAAHRGALKAKGRTIAVLGNGLARIYPPEHKELADKIVQSGALVSELPLNTPSNRRNFPPRNRIISGLSLGVIVVEAARNSGSLITAHWALEQGKEVFAVPGQIDNPRSRGTHSLIKEGAKLVEGIEDIVSELGPLSEVIHTQEGNEIKDPRELKLNPQEGKIFNLLSSTPKSIDEIIVESQLPASVVSSTLMILEIKKLVKQLSGKNFVRN